MRFDVRRLGSFEFLHKALFLGSELAPVEFDAGICQACAAQQVAQGLSFPGRYPSEHPKNLSNRPQLGFDPQPVGDR